MMWLEFQSASLTQFLYYRRMLNVEKWEDEPQNDKTHIPPGGMAGM